MILREFNIECRWSNSENTRTIFVILRWLSMGMYLKKINNLATMIWHSNSRARRHCCSHKHRLLFFLFFSPLSAWEAVCAALDKRKWRNCLESFGRQRTCLRLRVSRDLKQARTATAVNKQLHFTVKNKPHTTNYIYCIFEAYFMIKSLWKNCIDCFEVK